MESIKKKKMKFTYTICRNKRYAFLLLIAVLFLSSFSLENPTKIISTKFYSFSIPERWETDTKDENDLYVREMRNKLYRIYSNAWRIPIKEIKKDMSNVINFSIESYERIDKNKMMDSELDGIMEIQLNSSGIITIDKNIESPNKKKYTLNRNVEVMNEKYIQSESYLCIKENEMIHILTIIMDDKIYNDNKELIDNIFSSFVIK